MAIPSMQIQIFQKGAVQTAGDVLYYFLVKAPEFGPVAQLGARRVRDAKVVGSNPVASTILTMKTDQNFKFWSVFHLFVY